VFSAPALLFFAFSGALQTFSLHKAKGSDYKPANWIVVMGELHKNQTTQLPTRKAQPGTASAPTKAARSTAFEPGSNSDAAELVAPSTTSSDLPRKRHPLPLKIFVVIVSLGFFSSVFTGVYMSYKYNRNRTFVTGVLLAGLVIPILLTFL
jgi:magnesium-transporting ATPase (P-type)